MIFTAWHALHGNLRLMWGEFGVEKWRLQKSGSSEVSATLQFHEGMCGLAYSVTWRVWLIIHVFHTNFRREPVTSSNGNQVIRIAPSIRKLTIWHDLMSAKEIGVWGWGAQLICIFFRLVLLKPRFRLLHTSNTCGIEQKVIGVSPA